MTIRNLLFFIFISSAPLFSQEWLPVRGGQPHGISGIAVIRKDANTARYLVVHDCKLPKQVRIGVVTVEGRSVKYVELVWPDSANEPMDAESLSGIPDTPNEFLFLASAGKLFHIALDSTLKNISVIRTVPMPDAATGSNFEGFSVQKISGRWLAVWAHRGQDEKPAVIYWAGFDKSNDSFSKVNSAEIKVPFPKQGVRHISDLRVDGGGNVYITSASDAGDDGPFQSAVYIAGHFSENGKQFTINPDMTRLYQTYYHKIEAMELIPGDNGGFIYGSDDENMGGSIYITW